MQLPAYLIQIIVVTVDLVTSKKSFKVTFIEHTTFPQETNIVNFDPNLLPIQPSDEVVNISYGLRSFDHDSYRRDEVINVVLDTPYNVRDVSNVAEDLIH